MSNKLRTVAVGLVCICLQTAGACSESKAKPDTGPRSDGWVSCPSDFPLLYENVCIARKPNKEAARTQCGEIVEDCDTTGMTSPDLACFSGAAPTAPSGPTSVTLAGFIDVFSSGPDADGIKVEVYDSASLMSAIISDDKAGNLKAKTFPSVTPLGTDTVVLNWTDQTKIPEDATRGKSRACPTDKKLKLPCIVPQLECGPSKQLCDLKGDQYCHTDKCIERLRWETRYQIKGIPTNRYLVIRTRGTKGFDDATWGIMAQFNVYLRADASKCKTDQFNDCINTKGEYELEVNALSKGDYSTIPITAGLSGGVPPGHGAIAGEVHDCDDIRLESFMVGSNPTPHTVTYFNGNPIKTLPDLARASLGTNADGIFAELDIEPGELQIGTLGLVGGKEVSAGKLRVGVLPDTVTVVTFEGRKPAP